MRRVDFRIPIYLPDPVYQALRSLKHGRMPSRQASSGLNLLGDRDVEWTWLAANIPQGPGAALDFGTGGSNTPLLLAQRGFDVTAVDLGPIVWHYSHPHLSFVQGDILQLPLPAAHFDLITNCSTVEHVGLVGRYGVVKDLADGDLDAMARLRQLMKSGGTMLLTIPVGQDAVFVPYCRIYGQARLPKLLQGFTVKKEEYWIKGGNNLWQPGEREAALNFKASVLSTNIMEDIYALGCFVLAKP